MPHRSTFITLLFILSIAVQSCSPKPAAPQPDTSSASNPPAPANPTAVISEVIQTPTDLPLDENKAPLPPPDLFDLFKQESSEDPTDNGPLLVKLLQYAAGEITADQAAIPANLRANELTPLLTQARLWLAGPGAGSPEKDEINRLLNRLMPAGDALLPYARAESQAARPSGLAKLSPRTALGVLSDTTELCMSLWDTGFPTPGPGTPPPVCVLYREFTAGGVDFRVFYPIEWQTSGANLAYIDGAEEALRRSVEAFLPLAHAGIPDTDLVFTLLPHTNSEGELRPLVYAAAFPFTDDRCSVGVFPHALDLDVPGFQQTLAHEIFHCFQDRNFDHPFSGSPEANNWFVEGSAEYFGNVAFPTVNAEYEFIDDISANIALFPLFELDYENFLFFQFLGNRIGNEALISLLASLPSEADTSVYASKLHALLPDLSEVYQVYAQDYYDRLIGDSGGGTVPVRPVAEYTEVIDLGTTTYTIDPFVVPHWRLVFPEDRTYTLSQSSTGSGREGFQNSGASREWGPLPTNISTLCGERVIILTSTSVEIGSEYEVRVEADYEESPADTGAGCDRCLVGTWQMTPETVDGFMSSTLPAGIAYRGHSGRILTTFTSDGYVLGVWEDFKISATMDAGGTPRDVEMAYTGFSTGDWYTLEGRIYYLNSVSNLILTITSGGITAPPTTIGDSPGSSSLGDGPYTCEGDTVTFTPTVEPVYPRVFQKVSP